MSEEKKRQQFLYSVVRFVPDTARGEFVNVGVIVTDDNGNTKQAWVKDFRRAEDLAGSERLVGIAKEYIRHLDHRIDDQGINKQELIEEYEMRNNLIQLSQPAPCSYTDVESALNHVFNRLVVEPVPVS